MMTLIKAFWKPLTISGFIIVALCLFSHARYQAGFQKSDSAWKLKEARRLKDQATNQAREEASARNEEERRKNEARMAADEADRKLAALRAEAANAQSVSNGLRATLSDIKRQLAASETGRLSATAAASAARAQTAILLANVLDRADQRAGELAEYADRARIAGETCERIYNTTSEQQQ